VPLGVPVEPLEYSQNAASSAQVSATWAAALPDCTSAATESAPLPPATNTCLSAGMDATSGSNTGSSGAETNRACARESRSMKSKSLPVSSVLAATGTTPASRQPRNTTGHSGVSSMATITRVSGARWRARRALASRWACSASSP
jgi:hypothetical protein